MEPDVMYISGHRDNCLDLPVPTKRLKEISLDGLNLKAFERTVQQLRETPDYQFDMINPYACIMNAAFMAHSDSYNKRKSHLEHAAKVLGFNKDLTKDERLHELYYGRWSNLEPTEITKDNAIRYLQRRFIRPLRRQRDELKQAA